MHPPPLLSRNHIPLGLFAVLLLLDVAVRVMEKIAVMHANADAQALFAISLLKQPWWWLGLALGPLQLWVWTRILARTALSLAYPLSSLGYPLTMLAAQLGFGEQLGARVWAGALLIVAGAGIIGAAAQEKL